MRILVTGSRHWAHSWIPASILIEYVAGLYPVTVVEGACPTGVDLFINAYSVALAAQGYAVSSERHQADWSTGKGAGFARNELMCELGADVCLAFIRNNSAGATHTATRAVAYGIPVRIFREDAEGSYLGEDES